MSRTAHGYRLAGEGEAGVRGGPPGDLYIFLSMASHPFFQRDGADLHCRVPVSMVTAAMGGDCEVPTIDGGKTKVKIPEGSQSGRRFRLQGKGMPVLRTRQNGDMYVQVMVETPQKLTKKQRELLAEFDRLSSVETQPGIRRLPRQGQGIPRRLGRPHRFDLSGSRSNLPPWSLSRECFKNVTFGGVQYFVMWIHAAPGPAKV